MESHYSFGFDVQIPQVPPPDQREYFEIHGGYDGQGKPNKKARIPNFGRYPTVHSIKSGNWSDPTTWNTGRVPGKGDIVSISTGTTVIYDIGPGGFQGTASDCDCDC